MIDSMEAMKVISKARGEAIVVTTMTAKNEWHQASTCRELDFGISGAMSKASSLGFGLALAQPDRKVIIIDGDGSLLMNLGSLVTIANMAPSNLIHFVIENGVYRITGGQPTPNSRKVSFSALARDAGYTHSFEFDDLAFFQSKIKNIMEQPGPTFVCLKCPSISERSPYKSPTTSPDSVRKFRASLI